MKPWPRGTVCDLSPFLRLAVEAAVCGGMGRRGFHARVTGIAAVDAVLSTPWLVVIVNSVNLLENADGILANVSAVSAVAVAIAAEHRSRAVRHRGCGAALPTPQPPSRPDVPRRRGIAPAR